MHPRWLFGISAINSSVGLDCVFLQPNFSQANTYEAAPNNTNEDK